MAKSGSETIILERHEFIGEIVPGSGTESMVVAAFKMAGEYLSEHDDQTGVNIEFKYYGRTFNASLLPDESLSSVRKDDY
jgi:hypothetical protein